MPKNIIICCDGTGNEFGRSNSNVVKLYGIVDRIPNHQIAYYDPGVGTTKSPGIGLSIKANARKLLGLVTGYGLYDNVYEAYSYLMENYEDGDKVFLFGFSRGAYTVRVLAGFLFFTGLLEKGCQNLIPYAFNIYSQKKPDFDKGFRFKARFSRTCKIEFMGIWDTVSSVGYFGNWRTFPYTANNKLIKTIRHAIAIDERRAYYTQNNLGSKNADVQDIKEVWFPGVHSDVGGSYPEEESGLAKIPLQWMLNEAFNHGLIVDFKRYMRVVLGDGGKYVEPNPLGKLHKSLRSFWYTAEIIPKSVYDYDNDKKSIIIPFGKRRTIVEDSFIHESVFQRLKGDSTYKPKNLPEKYQVEETIDNIVSET